MTGDRHRRLRNRKTPQRAGLPGQIGANDELLVTTWQLGSSQGIDQRRLEGAYSSAGCHQLQPPLAESPLALRAIAPDLPHSCAQRTAISTYWSPDEAIPSVIPIGRSKPAARHWRRNSPSTSRPRPLPARSRARRPAPPHAGAPRARYFRLSVCIVCEPRMRRILPRSDCD
jgi:hypothetical protein